MGEPEHGRHRADPDGAPGDGAGSSSAAGHGSADGASRGLGRPTRIGGRLLVGLVSLTVLTATGIGWSVDLSGTSNAVAAAGNVGVVSAPAALRPTVTDDPATRTVSPTGSPTPGAPTGDSVAAGPPVPPVPAENILLVGADSRTDAQGNPLTPEQQAAVGVTLDGGGVNTDTLLIIHIPAGGGRATGISIPRDTWMGPDVVGAPGVTGPDQDGHQVQYLPNKINSFYSTAKYYDEQYLRSQGVTGAELERESDEAGRTMLIKVIQQFTGIKIDHYAEVNLLGFYLMSQAIGGVQVCLLHAVDDRRSGADFPAGEQTVEGKAALAFVRQRYGLPGADLGRIKREQAFLGSALDKILSGGTLTSPAKLAALVDAARKSIVLDSGFDLLTFAEQMQGLVAGNVQFTTVPTTDDTGLSTTDAQRADPAQVRALFAAVTAGQPLPSVRVTTSGAAPSSSVAAGATTTPSSTTASVSPESVAMSSGTGQGGYTVPCVN